jgi:MFS family permease
LFTLFIWLGNGFPSYLIGYFLIGSYITAHGLAIAQGRTLVKAANMGLAYGSLETAMAIAIILGPPVAGMIYQIRPEWVYIAGLLIITIGIWVYMLLSPLKHKDLVAFEESEKEQWTPP